MGLTIVGCGYVGLAVARQLQNRRAQTPLTLTTTREERRTELMAFADRVLLCDATQPQQLTRALQGSRTALFCLGPKGDRQVDSDGYRHTFVDSFACLRDLLPELPGLQQIIYTSSCSVYGDADGAWVDEATAPNPGPGHAAVLLEGEALLSGFHDRQICILRLGALHGPGRNLDERLRGLAGQQRPGDGQQFTNWVHVEDAAGAVVAAMNGAWTGVVNVGNNTPIRLKDLVDDTLKRQGLMPVHWSGGQQQVVCNRRISNGRLTSLGYQLLHPGGHDQSGVLPASQVP